MKRITIVALFVALCAGSTVRASDKPSGFRAAALTQLDDLEQKVEGLANAIPEAKYGWRPADGVRSVSEVFMHIAGANFLIPTFAGVKAPAGVDENMEKVTEKAKVLEALRASFAHLKTAIANASDADLDKPTKMFGHDTTYLGVWLTTVTHIHEHLGQSIAYARMNGVIPPWSMPADKK